MVSELEPCPTVSVTDDMVEAALATFSGGLVRQTDERNERGYTTYYRPKDSMRAVLTEALSTLPPQPAEDGLVEAVQAALNEQFVGYHNEEDARLFMAEGLASRGMSVSPPSEAIKALHRIANATIVKNDEIINDPSFDAQEFAAQALRAGNAPDAGEVEREKIAQWLLSDSARLDYEASGSEEHFSWWAADQIRAQAKKVKP